MKKKRKDLSAAEIKLLSKKIDALFLAEKVICDSKVRELIDLAKQGEYRAFGELKDIFFYGDTSKRRNGYTKLKAKKNFKIARFFSEEYMKYLAANFAVDEVVKWQYGLEIEDRALIEWFDGNLEKAEKFYQKAIRYMLKHVPPKEWDFRVFLNYETLIIQMGKKELHDIAISPECPW